MSFCRILICTMKAASNTSSIKKTVKNKIIQNRAASRSISNVKRVTILSKKSTTRFGKKLLKGILLSKTFNIAFKVVIICVLFSSAMYGAYAFIGNKIGDEVVVSKSEIIARAGKHIELPNENPEAVVRVEDPETLKKQMSFFENAKEGDYIIMYPNLAIIYDLRNDNIVAFKRSR